MVRATVSAKPRQRIADGGIEGIGQFAVPRQVDGDQAVALGKLAVELAVEDAMIGAGAVQKQHRHAFAVALRHADVGIRRTDRPLGAPHFQSVKKTGATLPRKHLGRV